MNDYAGSTMANLKYFLQNRNQIFEIHDGRNITHINQTEEKKPFFFNS